MAPRTSLVLPTTSPLPSSNRLPATHPSVTRALTKLSRPALLSLIQEWLKDVNQATCAPSLAGSLGDDDSGYEAARSLDELKELYEELQQRKGGKREVVDRVIDGDWRNGISLKQLAMVDVQYLLDHPTSQRWTALKLARTSPSDGSSQDDPDSLKGLPQFHGHTFLKNLQGQIGALVRAHYHMSRIPTMPITLLRIYIHDFPYNNPISFSKSSYSGSLDASKMMYVAFPDNTPAIYVSLAMIPGKMSGGDSRSVRRIVMDAIPKAFSRPHERYVLKPTSLSARSLSALVSLRGPGRGNAAAGGWSIFAEGTVEMSPLLNSITPIEIQHHEDQEKENIRPGSLKANRKRPRSNGKGIFGYNDLEEPLRKRWQALAKSRFGESGMEDDGKGIERFDIRLEDPFQRNQRNEGGGLRPEENVAAQASTSRRGRRSTFSLLEDASHDMDDAEDDSAARGWCPNIQLTFHGTHIFAGIRNLVESAAVDGSKMPGWMTGENGVSTGVVRNGRIRGHKGSGL